MPRQDDSHDSALPGASRAPWRLQWTPSQVRTFWNWIATRPGVEDLYFSNVVGDSVLDQAATEITFGRRVVDYGAGAGYLVQKLAERGFDVLAMDTSPESVRLVIDRMGQRAHFLGAHVVDSGVTPLDDNCTDTVFLIETVEHLDDDAMASIVREIRRILRPGGHLVVTTPNEEDLAASETVCPNCACVFHRMQHCRSFTAQSLSDTLAKLGLRAVVARPTLFSTYPRWLRPLQRAKFNLGHAKLPHLLYIGAKV